MSVTNAREERRSPVGAPKAVPAMPAAVAVHIMRGCEDTSVSALFQVFCQDGASVGEVNKYLIALLILTY